MKESTHPYVFISYSWDSDDHKEKVKKFVQALRLDNINVTYDGDLQFGEHLPHYIEKSILNSDIVLFICTPNYKYCADSRISDVGVENQVITDELYDTCNEKKYIPVLFSGTWETSLPTWAKGKLGVDLSTQEFYKSNYEKLILHLQNAAPNFIMVGATEKNIERKKLLSRTCIKIYSLILAIKMLWKNISDVTTFRGLVLVAVVAGVILLIISPFLSSSDASAPENYSVSNTIASGESTDSIPDTPAPENSSISNTMVNEEYIDSILDAPALDSSSISNAIANEKNTDNSVPGNESIENANTNDSAFNSNVSDNSTPSKAPYDEDAFNTSTLERLISGLDMYPDNGTMPKGTAPITITLPNDIQEKLVSIQKLSIGSSKKWIDDKLGPPYAEAVMDFNDDGLIRYSDDKTSKTGELLVCAYNISDIIVVQACFDISDNSCLAYFVTLLDDISGVDIKMPKFYSSLVSDKSLGEFAFSELGENITSTYGYAGQGVGRTFYGEEYYFAADGNYNTFYFAVLDYGMLDSHADFIHFLSIIQFNIGPHDETLPLPEVLNSKREEFYPNTYGISTLNSALTFDLLSDYYWFDTLSLSNWGY